MDSIELRKALLKNREELEKWTLREMGKYSYSKLQKITNINSSYLHKVRNGKTRLNLDTLIDVSEKLAKLAQTTDGMEHGSNVGIKTGRRIAIIESRGNLN